MTKKALIANNEPIWQRFAEQESLSQDQVEKFKIYADLLQEWNEKINLTAIGGTKSIVQYHFQDSLRLAKAVDMEKMKTIADVGTGGGFPGIPLAIVYPKLQVLLIEVSFKKIQFLDAVITALNLEDRISVYDKDWRTFLRTTDFNVDCFCARASLQPEELLRMFKPASPYKDSLLIYWASAEWEPSEKVKPFIEEYVRYKVGNKARQLVVIKR